MKIKLKEFDVNSKDPFENDLLNRKESAEILTQFVSRLDEPYVIALNSEWGTGKTTFLKMWKSHLELQKFNVIYFNAWENDFNNVHLFHSSMK
jgi:predicted KAP-like P-loop ATPase